MMRSLLLAAVGAVLCQAAAAEYKPEPWNLDARRKFTDQRFGIFIHWGLYANYAQGEWYLESGKVKEADYARMKDGFYPSKFDAREWVRVFKNAGARYVTVTSRHHDGFSLWPTKVDDGYNVANTPFKRDILGELAEACREEGLQLNFYYSLMDWHRPDYPTGGRKNARSTLANRREDYQGYKRFMMGQIAELLDNYHPGNIWFDGEWDHVSHDKATGKAVSDLDWEFDDIYDLIHSKKALVANNNHAGCRPKEDIQLFERDLPGENSEGFSAGQQVTVGRPLEQCDVIQKGIWGYRIASGAAFRTADDVVAMVARAAAKGSNLLMNIGPDGSGQLPAQAVSVMADVGKWFAKNGESIYGTQAGGVAQLRDIVSTRKGNVLYLHFLNPQVNKFAFALQGRIADVRVLDGRATALVERTTSGDAVVTVKRPAGDLFDIVVKMTVVEE